MKKLFMILIICVFATGIVFAQDAKKAKTAQEYISDLASKDEKTIIEAADWLGKEGEKGAVPELSRLVEQDSRQKVRMYAIIALGLIKQEESVDVLNKALVSDSDADVRYSAILAISRIGSTKSIDALQKAKETETDPFIKDYITKLEAKFKK
ncbi:MAG: HEAT repeat domain-containing protein [Spirochaetes bacterium]|nr:MAG: HEAT repeat domain-containing protein [Spirochaetota bacterium]